MFKKIGFIIMFILFSSISFAAIPVDSWDYKYRFSIYNVSDFTANNSVIQNLFIPNSPVECPNGSFMTKFNGNTSVCTSSGWIYNGTTIITDGSPKVGIGTNNPTAILQTNGEPIFENTGTGLKSGLTLRNLAGNASNTGIGINFKGIGSASMGWIYSAWTGNNNNNTYMSFYTRKSGTMTEQMRIDNSGNVGIGITSPSYKLDVNGTLNTKGNTTITIPYGEIFNKTTTDRTFTIASTGIYYNLTGFNQAKYLNGFTNGTDRLTAQIAGLYEVTFTMSVNCGLGGSYGVAIVQNYENPETNTDDCYNHFDGAASHNIRSVVCFKRLAVGDNISVVLEDNDVPAQDCILQSIRLGAKRIGE